MENKVYIALGSNLGNREKQLEESLQEISELGKITAKSRIYETEPIGYKEQDKFLNMVIELSTKQTPTELIVKLQEIEHKMGRKREIENGPRTIDLDILLYNQESIDTQYLKIPHPRMHKRKFVLEPLNEIAPNANHPVLNKSVNQLWTNLK